MRPDDRDGTEEGRSRLTDLDRRLRDAQARRQAAQKPRGGALGGDNRGLGLGLRVGIDIVAAVAVGVVAGILLDRWLGTAPWFLLVFFLLGCGAAFMSVYRTAMALEAARRQPGDATGKAGNGDETRERGRGGAA